MSIIFFEYRYDHNTKCEDELNNILFSIHVKIRNNSADWKISVLFSNY